MEDMESKLRGLKQPMDLAEVNKAIDAKLRPEINALKDLMKNVEPKLQPATGTGDSELADEVTRINERCLKLVNGLSHVLRDSIKESIVS